MGQLRLIDKAIDGNEFYDLSISFKPDQDLHCSCTKRTRERLKSVNPSLIMEGTSQEIKTGL